MEGSFATPYDPPSAVGNRQVDMEHRPSGVASVDPDLSSCATYLSRVCSSSGFSSGHRQIGPVDELKADMEGPFETPYDPPSAVDNRN